MSDVERERGRCGRFSSSAEEACVPLTDHCAVARERDRYKEALAFIASPATWVKATDIREYACQALAGAEQAASVRHECDSTCRYGCVDRERQRDMDRQAERAAADAGENEEPRWLKADPKTWRGSGVMSRRSATPDGERR